MSLDGGLEEVDESFFKRAISARSRAFSASNSSMRAFSGARLPDQPTNIVLGEKAAHAPFITAILPGRNTSSSNSMNGYPNLRQVWHAPERKSWGVYLWCIEYHGEYLVNYVGKTTSSGGFENRLWTELRDWRNGRYWTPVDLEAFKNGKRILLPNPPPNHRQIVLDLHLKEIEPLCRILLAPIREKSNCRRVENEIVHRLRAHGAAFQFLSNLDKHTKYPHDPAVEIPSPGNPPIIGLTAPIPQSLR